MENTLSGTLRQHKAFKSRFLKESRDIVVYLPPDYNTVEARHYPVLYLQDGQNLFDAATAFGGNEWGLDEVAEQLISKARIEPSILVGIYNTGANRLAEYTHVPDQRGQGGNAKQYGRMLVEELKPFIDSEYRTLQEPGKTGLGGSSLGGLVTLYLGLRYPEVFGKLLVMSPSVWWANRAILREVKKLKRKPHQKIWLDVGTAEGSNPEQCVEDARLLRDALIAKGWKLGDNLHFVEDDGAGHNEQAWGFRVREALPFLFSPEAR